MHIYNDSARTMGYSELRRISAKRLGRANFYYRTDELRFIVENYTDSSFANDYCLSLKSSTSDTKLVLAVMDALKFPPHTTVKSHDRFTGAAYKRAVGLKYWLNSSDLDEIFSKLPRWDTVFEDIQRRKFLIDVIDLASHPMLTSAKSVKLLEGLTKTEILKSLENSKDVTGKTSAAIFVALKNSMSAKGQLYSEEFLSDPEAVAKIRGASSPFLASSIVFSSYNRETLNVILANWDDVYAVAAESTWNDIYALVSEMNTAQIIYKLFTLPIQDALKAFRTLLSYEEQITSEEGFYIIENVDDLEGLPIEWIRAMMDGRDRPELHKKESLGVRLRPGVAGVSLRQKVKGLNLIVRETPKQVSCITLKLDLNLGCYVPSAKSAATTDSFEIATFIPVSADYNLPASQVHDE